MGIKRPNPKEIVNKLRQVEVLMGQGMPHLDAIREICVVEQTHYRWRRQYGGMGKLHNARAILSDLRDLGEDLWSRFTGKKEGTLWYYRSLVNAFKKVF